MNRFKKFINITTIPFTIIGIITVVLAYYEGYFDDSPSYASSQIKILEEI